MSNPKMDLEEHRLLEAAIVVLRADLAEMDEWAPGHEPLSEVIRIAEKVHEWHHIESRDELDLWDNLEALEWEDYEISEDALRAVKSLFRLFSERRIFTALDSDDT